MCEERIAVVACEEANKLQAKIRELEGKLRAAGDAVSRLTLRNSLLRDEVEVKKRQITSATAVLNGSAIVSTLRDVT